MIQEKLEQIKKGELTAEKNISDFLKKIEKENAKLNIFLHINKDAVKQAKAVDKKTKKGRLAGLGIAVKANINVKGMPVSCASKTLESYNATYDAEVLEKIKKEDGIILGIVNMDEFACGSTGETSAFKPTQNPAAKGLIPGGSSSGSAAAVAADFCDIALGSDTGGSIRNPASHCGVIGVKPSYGRVSRYGLIDLAMSFDQIGPLCKDTYGVALMMEIIAGKSDLDAITYDKPVDSYTKNLEHPAKSLRIGLSSDFKKLCKDKKIYELIEKKAKELAEKTNSKIKNINLKYVDLGVATYYPIVYTEFFSGTRKFDGRRYGKKIEDSCGEEVLRRILGGKEISKAEYHGTYYRKALAAKELIKKEFESAFKQVDIILTPVTPKLPYKMGENMKLEDVYAFDAFTVLANLAEICAGVVPAGKIDNAPVGIQIMAPPFKEESLLKTMRCLE